MRKIRILALILVLSGGCAFTQSSTPLNYQYRGDIGVQFQSDVSLTVKEFKDSRNVNDETVIFQKSNAYGKTSGSFRAEKPFTDIVREAIIVGLEKSGAKIVTGDTKLRLEGELIENDYDVHMGFWSGTVTNNITVKLKLSDDANNDLLWQDTITGKATDKSSWGSSNFLLDLCKNSIDDLVKKVVADDYFRQELEKN